MTRLHCVAHFLRGLSFAAVLATSAAASEPAPPSTADPEARPADGGADPDIVVTGQSLQALDDYIEELTESPHGQIARWNGEICPRALGLSPSQNAYLAGAVADVAREVRIPVERGACRANILIVITEEADEFVRLLLKRHPRLFGAFGSGRPPAAAVEALAAPRPVRWVNASAWGNGQGAPLVDGNNWVYSTSRLQETTRENATLSLVIVDSTKVGGVTWGALSSYLAMVALARPAPDLDLGGSSTILSLFRNRDQKRRGPKTLTQRDREFLRGLYSSKANVSASAQRLEIRRRMEKGMERSQKQEQKE